MHRIASRAPSGPLAGKVLRPLAALLLIAISMPAGLADEPTQKEMQDYAAVMKRIYDGLRFSPLAISAVGKAGAAATFKCGEPLQADCTLQSTSVGPLDVPANPWDKKGLENVVLPDGAVLHNIGGVQWTIHKVTGNPAIPAFSKQPMSADGIYGAGGEMLLARSPIKTGKGDFAPTGKIFPTKGFEPGTYELTLTYTGYYDRYRQKSATLAVRTARFTLAGQLVPVDNARDKGVVAPRADPANFDRGAYEAALLKIYPAVKLGPVALSASTMRLGEVIRPRCALTNVSSSAIVAPRSASAAGGFEAGHAQWWVRRTGGGGKGASNNRESICGCSVAAPYEQEGRIDPGQSIEMNTLQVVLEADSLGVGSFEVGVDYKDHQGKVLASQSAKFQVTK